MTFRFFSKQSEPKGIERTPAQVARFLEDFLHGAGPKWEWDDFLATAIADPELDKIRKRCQKLDLEFPPAKPGDFCGPAGLEVVRGYVEQLHHATPTP